MGLPIKSVSIFSIRPKVTQNDEIGFIGLVATRKQTDMNVNPGEHERLLLQI
mgnify:FL=1